MDFWLFGTVENQNPESPDTTTAKKIQAGRRWMASWQHTAESSPQSCISRMQSEDLFCMLTLHRYDHSLRLVILAEHLLTKRGTKAGLPFSLLLGNVDLGRRRRGHLASNLRFNVFQHAVGNLDLIGTGEKDVWVEQGGIRHRVEICHHSFQFMIQKDRLAEEQNCRTNAEENLEGALNEPDIPHVADGSCGHRWEVKEQCLKPSQGKDADIEAVVVKVVGEDG